jgi:hypothetical protein
MTGVVDGSDRALLWLLLGHELHIDYRTQTVTLQ